MEELYGAILNKDQKIAELTAKLDERETQLNQKEKQIKVLCLCYYNYDVIIYLNPTIIPDLLYFFNNLPTISYFVQTFICKFFLF